MTLLAICLCIFMPGCKSDVATISSKESRSPDGLWLAIAHTDQYGGSGTAGVITTVSLKPVDGTKSSIEVLQLSQNDVSVDLKMNWLTSSHLEVTYTKPASVDFLAIKCAGIDISARNLSNGRTTPLLRPDL
jgi:hypothetical protein